MADLDPRSVLPRLPTTKKLHALCGTLLADGWHVGLGSIPRLEVPGSNPKTYQNVEPPYAILYSLWSNTSGPWDMPDADAEWLYQITMVAKRGDQIEWMRDRFILGLFGRDTAGHFVQPLDVDGVKVMYRSIRDDTGNAPDNAVPGAGVTSADLRFSLGVTPDPAA